MGYRLMGWTAIRAMRTWDRMKDQRGQGTVEYIGIVVMVALLAGAVAVVSKGWGGTIGNALKKGLVDAINGLVGGLASR
jgi:Flp pilus assembly pilin Flp